MVGTSGFSTFETAKRLAPPAFRGGELVEGVDVEAGDSVPAVTELRRQALDQGAGPVAVGHQQAREQPAVPPDESRRLADADPRRDPEELSALNRSRNSDVDRQPDAAGSDGSDPPREDAGVQAELTDDVRGKRLLVEHHLNRGLVADEGVALRVAGNAHFLDAVLELGYRHQQRRRPVELPCRQVDIAGDRKDVADAHRDKPLEEVPQVVLVSDEASCEMRGNLEPDRRELLAHSQGRLDPP